MLIAERILVSPLSADGGVSPRSERNATMIGKEDRAAPLRRDGPAAGRR
jgi:hypothetical protein